MFSINDDRQSIIYQAMWTNIGHCRFCIMEMFKDVFVTLDAFFLTQRVFSVEFRTQILPRDSYQNVAIIVNDCRREGINTVQLCL